MSLSALEVKNCIEDISFTGIDEIRLEKGRKVVKKLRPFISFTDTLDEKTIATIIDGYSRSLSISYSVTRGNRYIVQSVIKKLDGKEIDRYDRT